ncbi:hypothetical protein ACXR0O_03455 [Verrucomicrobiota bacterium sgz303538]
MSPLRNLFRSIHSLARPTGESEHNSPDTASTPSDLWRRASIRTWQLGANLTAVQVATSRNVHVLPAATAEWLLSCTDWTSLDEHLEKYRYRHATDARDWEALVETVPALRESRLLISGNDLLDWCRSEIPPQSTHRSISAIGFPTGGPDGLTLAPRAVQSFAENLREQGREADLIVCDSSLDPALREGQRSQLRALAKQLGRPIRYVGAEEKQQFAKHLVRLGACSPQVVDFALRDPFETGFAPGANRNVLLLDQAGSMFCSVDHDVLCRVTRAPKPGAATLSLFSDCDPFARWTFADRATADKVSHWETPDHLALHESMLGRDTGTLLPAGVNGSVDFQNAADTILARLSHGTTRVRATFCGHSGEPGVPSAAYYLAYRGVNRARLTASETHYRESLSSRCLLALSTTPAVGDASLSPGVAFGLDHRELLPPFFPVLHAEDFSWSALAWQCCPGAVFGLLPWAVAHEPIPGKAFLQIRDLVKSPPFVIWEWAHLLRFWTLSWQPPGGADASARIRSFARVLEEIAALPEADFGDELRRVALATASHQIAFYEAQLTSETEHVPNFWRADVEAYLTHLQRAVACDGFELPLDLQQQCRSLPEARAFAQQLVARYAALLSVWPDMVAAALDMKREGHVIGVL